MKLLLLGKNGQVGFELQRSLAPLGEVHAHCRRTCDLTDSASVRNALETTRPDVIVHAAAYTAVDKAESERGLALRVNAESPRILAEYAARRGALLVHYSTDYVYDGSKASPYVENDATGPLNVYGETKLAGEDAIRGAGCAHLIFRTSWVFGGHGNNFLKTILRLARERDRLTVVADQIGAPTPASLIADVTAHAIRRWYAAPERFAGGVYHLAPSGETSWHGYAQFVVANARELGAQLALSASAVVPISTAEYPTAARRPANSRLETTKLRNYFGLTMPTWQSGVLHVLQLMTQGRP
ncbi:MAG: dTDP-4-dehydrorhamnose reductase [Sulfurifustis sp.]